MQATHQTKAGPLTLGRRGVRTPGSSWPWFLVLSVAGLWALAISYLAVVRHMNLLSGYDLGIFAHIAWTSSQGRPFYQSLTEGTNNFLNVHFAPLLIVLAPLYAAWPDPSLLLVVQAAALAAAAIPLFAFARRRIGTRPALLVVLLYLVSPIVHNIAFDQFHEIALAVPLLMAAGAALLDRRMRATIVWLGLALLVKEEIAMIAIGFGLYALLVQRRWRDGAVLLGGALAWCALLYTALMPALRQNGGGTNFASHYRILGSTPEDMLRTLLTRPLTVARLLTTRMKLQFVWQLLAPLGGLPLLGLSALLLVLPQLAYLMLGDDGTQVDARFHYTAVLVPFLLLAAVCGLQWLRARNCRLAQAAALAALLAALVSAWFWSPLPGAHTARLQDFVVSDEARATRQLLATIPPAATVAADSTYQPWLANRWWLADVHNTPFQQFHPAPVAEYVVEQAPGPYGVTPPVYPWVIDDLPDNPLRVRRYEQAGVTPGGVTVWRWRGPEADVSLQRYEVRFWAGLRLVGAGTPPDGPAWGPVIAVRPGERLPIWLAWGADNPLDRALAFSLHLFSEDGRLVAQVDQEMGEGRFRTTLWHTWLDSPVIAGQFPLVIPPDLPPGRYSLMAGAFDADLVAALTQPDGNPWVSLTSLEVSAP
jgi:uncharacterized membrane protein